MLSFTTGIRSSQVFGAAAGDATKLKLSGNLVSFLVNSYTFFIFVYNTYFVDIFYILVDTFDFVDIYILLIVGTNLLLLIVDWWIVTRVSLRGRA